MSHEIPFHSDVATCSHISCFAPRRLEYCEIEARDPESDAVVNVETIDYILLKHDRPDTRVEYLNDGRMRYLSYRFDYIQEDSTRPPIQTGIRIVHAYDVQLQRSNYEVDIGWRVIRSDANNDFYNTVYTLEQYPNVIYSTIDEIDLSTQQLKTGERPTYMSRPMTGYDHQILNDYLSIVSDSHDAELYIDSND